MKVNSISVTDPTLTAVHITDRDEVWTVSQRVGETHWTIDEYQRGDRTYWSHNVGARFPGAMPRLMRHPHPAMAHLEGFSR